MKEIPKEYIKKNSNQKGKIAPIKTIYYIFWNRCLVAIYFNGIKSNRSLNIFFSAISVMCFFLTFLLNGKEFIFTKSLSKQWFYWVFYFLIVYLNRCLCSDFSELFFLILYCKPLPLQRFSNFFIWCMFAQLKH